MVAVVAVVHQLAPCMLVVLVVHAVVSVVLVAVVAMDVDVEVVVVLFSSLICGGCEDVVQSMVALWGCGLELEAAVERCGGGTLGCLAACIAAIARVRMW